MVTQIDPKELDNRLKIYGQHNAEFWLYDNYYHGLHRLRFATEKFRTTFGYLFREFSLNYCPIVIDSLADKLIIQGFDSQYQDLLDPFLKKAKFSLKSQKLHSEALKSGNSYCIIWPDPEDGKTPCIYPQRTSHIMLIRDQEYPEKKSYALKVWRNDDGRFRMTIYYPDRIEKYITKQKADLSTLSFKKFVPYQDDPDQPWVYENPYGEVPVFQIANSALPSEMGQSELRDILPIQDALNLSVLNLLVAMEFHSLPQRWATGLQVDIDENTGRPVEFPFTPGVDRVWAVGDDKVRFGQFDQAQLEQIIKIKDSFLTDIARLSSTPSHYFLLTDGSKPTSGNALETVESRFKAKVQNKQEVFGDSWVEAMTFCLKIMGKVDDDLEILWKDPSPRDEKTFWETAVTKNQLGVSKKQVLREAGYSEDQIADFDSENAAEPKPANPLADMFNQGTGPFAPSGGDSNPFGGNNGQQ